MGEGRTPRDAVLGLEAIDLGHAIGSAPRGDVSGAPQVLSLLRRRLGVVAVFARHPLGVEGVLG